jgi:hypothetical protein
MSLNPLKRKGCLTALGLAIPILALLYIYCTFAPTGYEKVAESSRAARRRFMETRFAPPPRTPPVSVTVPQTPDPAPVSPTESTASTSETEMLDYFRQLSDGGKNWDDIGRKLLEFDPYHHPFEILESFPGDSTNFISTPETGDVKVASSELNEIESRIRLNTYQISKSYLNQVKNYLQSPAGNATPSETDPGKEMDRLEKMLEENRWDRFDAFDLAQAKDKDDARTILRSDATIRAIFRALRRGEPEKADRLIERYVRLAGKQILAFEYQYSFVARVSALGRFLFLLTLEPKVPDETLERIAATLASWRLDAQESRDLQTASLLRSRDILVASLKVGFDPDHNSFWQRNDWGSYPLKALEKAGTCAAEPALFRTIDRKAVALIAGDAPAYKLAHQQLKMALGTIRMARMERFFFGKWDYSSPDDYGTLLLKDGLTIQYESVSGTKTLFDEFTQGEVPLYTDCNVASPGSLYNLQIARLRLMLAVGRYHREHGRYPASTREMVPRYLDESFTTPSEQFWTLLTTVPFNGILFPEADNTNRELATPSRFTRLVVAYYSDPRHPEILPTRIEDLKHYADPGEDLTPFAKCFVHLDALPVFGEVTKLKQREMGTPGGLITDVGWALQWHVPFPLLNLDDVPGYLPMEPKERKGPGK